MSGKVRRSPARQITLLAKGATVGEGDVALRMKQSED